MAARSGTGASRQPSRPRQLPIFGANPLRSRSLPQAGSPAGSTRQSALPWAPTLWRRAAAAQALARGGTAGRDRLLRRWAKELQGSDVPHRLTHTRRSAARTTRADDHAMNLRSSHDATNPAPPGGRSSCARWHTGHPRDLRDACSYVLTGGGKRVRASSSLLSCEAVGGTCAPALTPPPQSRSCTTSHWSTTTSWTRLQPAGTSHRPCAMESQHCTPGRRYPSRPSHTRALLKTGAATSALSHDSSPQGVIEVCEGQALDLEFERPHQCHAWPTISG